MKSTIASILVCALVGAYVASAASVGGQVETADKSDARGKRSVYVAAAPLVAASPVVATAPVVAATVPVVHSQVVHHNPTTVVKTEQVRSGDHASYSYSTEVKTQPIVHQTHSAAVVAAPVSTAVVSAVHHTVPTAYSYPYGYGYGYPYSYYSPYSYVLGK